MGYYTIKLNYVSSELAWAGVNKELWPTLLQSDAFIHTIKQNYLVAISNLHTMVAMTTEDMYDYLQSFPNWF